MDNVLPTKLACLVLVMTSGMPAEPGIPIKASHDAGILVLSDIFLDGHGPFGTTIDTLQRVEPYPSADCPPAGVSRASVVPFPSATVGTFTPSWTVLP